MSLKLWACSCLIFAAARVEDEQLARDDECASNDGTCSMQALQMHGAKTTSKESLTCSGTGPIPTSDDLCYTGAFLVEKFFVKVSKQTATGGTVDLQAIGPSSMNCAGAQFQQTGSELTVEDTANCGLVPGTDYTVTYCSNQDSLVVHMLKPMDVSVELKRTPCAEAEPQMLLAQQDAEAHAVAALESEKACSGYGVFPHGGACYSGAFLVENLAARVVHQGGHRGYVNMRATGPKHGHCKGVPYSMSGQYVFVNAAKCGLRGMQYSIRYCPDQDVINLHITSPLAGNVVMRRSGCGGVLLEEGENATLVEAEGA